MTDAIPAPRTAAPMRKLVGLLVAVIALRVGLVGTSVCLQLDLVQLGNGLPNFLLVGGASAFQGTVEIIFAPILARRADTIGTRAFLIGAPIVGAFADLIFSRIGIAPLFAIPLVLAGLTSAAFVPIALSTLAVDTGGSVTKRVASSSLFEGLTLLGYAGGFLLGPYLYGHFARGSFLVLSLCFVLSLVTCIVAVDPLPARPISPLRELVGKITASKEIRLFLPAWISANAIVGMFYANFAAIFHRRAVRSQTLVHHFSGHSIGLFASFWIGILVIGMILWIPLVVKWGPVKSMRYSIFGAFVTAGALLFINHHPLRLAWWLLPVLCAGILIESGFGPSAVSFLTGQSEEFAHDRASLMALYTITLAAGSALGAIVGGIASKFFLLNGILIASAVFAALALFAVFRMSSVRRSPA